MANHQNELEIAILKYDINFTKRSKDIKKNSWFSFPNDLLLHPDFDEISGEELKWFIWIVSICSIKNQDKIRLNISHAEKKLSLNRDHLFSMLNKLQGKQIDVVCDQSAAIARPHGGQSAASTLHYNTIHNTTLQNITEHVCAKASSVKTDLHPLIQIWNMYSGKLAKVRISNPTRNKKIKTLFNQISENEWVSVITKISESDFCNGKSSQGWKADFDFLIKPDSYLKVLEGKYDNRTTFIQTHINKTYDQLDALEAGLNLKNEVRDAN